MEDFFLLLFFVMTTDYCVDPKSSDIMGNNTPSPTFSITTFIFYQKQYKKKNHIEG